MTARTKKKIMVVDDEADIRRMVRSMLGDDYVVLEATDGKEAMDLARTESPDCILMDLIMPGMDGYTSLNRIKADPRTRPIPVAMLTAVGLVPYAEHSEKMGAVAYITKPFTEEDVKNAIDVILKNSP